MCFHGSYKRTFISDLNFLSTGILIVINENDLLISQFGHDLIAKYVEKCLPSGGGTVSTLLMRPKMKRSPTNILAI